MQASEPVRPSPLACEECRRRHLRCDGASPICGRCLTEGFTCKFTPSRRGRGRRNKCRSRVIHGATHRSIASSLTTDLNGPPTPIETASLREISPSGNDTVGERTSLDVHKTQGAAAAPPVSSSLMLSNVDRERLINLFYIRFYAAHPLLVPRAFYNDQRYPQYLDLVVCFIGYHYERPIPTAAALRDAVSSAMSSPHEQTVHRVQALILYAIILHARHQTKEAEHFISCAAKIAIDLGMNRPAFARESAALDPVIEESIRRTWWELYTVDVYVAALHRRLNFDTNTTKIHPHLPCSQSAYEAGKCDADPATLRAFEERVFASDPRSDFSSFCYRIEAIRIVDRVLALAATDEAPPDDIQAVDNALASWKYNLPHFHADVVDPSGEVDQMLFQAHFFIHCASIFLHFPRSDLPATVPSVADITCAKDYKQLTPTSTQHAIKAIAASKELSNLAAIPWPLDNHSPFFVCGLVLGCIVQLAAGSVHIHACGSRCLQHHRDRVVLMLGALRSLGQKWAVAQNAVHYLKVVADTIFSSHEIPEQSSVNSVHDSGIEISEIPNNTSWFDLFMADELQDQLFNV